MHRFCMAESAGDSVGPTFLVCVFGVEQEAGQEVQEW